MISNLLFICDLDSILKSNENVERRGRYLSLATYRDDSLGKTRRHGPCRWTTPGEAGDLGSGPDPTTHAPCACGLSSERSAWAPCVQGVGRTRPLQRALPDLPVAGRFRGGQGSPGTHRKVKVWDKLPARGN